MEMTSRLRSAALILLFLFSLGLGFFAHSQTMSVSGSGIEDSTGIGMINGTIYWAPVNNTGIPLSYKMPGSGQVMMTPVSATVVNGSFTGLSLPDKSPNKPAHVCFSITVIDNLTGTNLLGPEYSCVQPASTKMQSHWCSSTTCNFGLYLPSTPGLALITSGPPGPPELSGCTGSNCNGIVLTAPPGHERS